MAIRHWSMGKLVGVASLLALIGFLLYQFGLFVMVLTLTVRDPSSSAFMKASLNTLRQADAQAELKHEWVPYDRISTHLKRAVIASEDANFTNHDGVEWEAIKRAWQYNQRQAEQGGERRRGGSTISQQLAKNLFLSDSRSYWRKGQELIITYMLEAVLSKERILELYLNLAQWGEDVFGAQAAARHYFRTDAGKLGAAQAARLAAMLPNPAFYDRQGGNTAYLRQRANTLMQRMRMVTVP
ncbi:monofunctional biosynthetic peptidoglycan transglycosylase [Pusillimonas sp. CC-YST705]|uniref:Biosynthetic peptidoglycan transglycosylase n=2 Tax=Mesopusillimonas faecipullorum TaxID=2755040 RepID=A0ABS8C9X3_9BURK|nr:monofunctional biosynthetic peptidoglycan transglycosylase [Mesopusillimonas faecipullorum]